MPQPTPQYGHVVATRRTMGAGASLGRSAPVGHVATHWPHEVHTDADRRASPATPTFMACPRPSIEMAPIFCTSSQAVVHRPQRMHASRSSTKKDLDASVSKWWSAVKPGPARPWRAVAAPTWPKPFRPSPSESIERVRSRTAVRTRAASGCVVLTIIPSRAGRWQAAGVPRMPSTWTRQVRQAPSGARSGSLQSCGRGRPRRFTASSTVAPVGTSTDVPSMVRRRLIPLVPDPGLRERYLRGGRALGHLLFRGGSELDEAGDLDLAVQALALDPLAIALEEAAAHIRVERLALDPEHGRRLFPRQILFAVDDQHGVASIVAARL